MTESISGCLLGLALGDALGFVVEAEPPAAAAAYVRDWLQGGRAGTRSHPRFPFGQYSDDTQLARELLLSVRDSAGWSPEVFGARLALLFGEGRDVGAGPGSRGAGLRLHSGTSWQESGTPPPYAGNGSAMRVGPFAAALADDVEAMLRAASEQSRVTHRDPRCGAGAVAVAGAVALASAPGAVDPAAFLRTLAGWVAREDSSVAAAVAGVEAWLELPPAAAAERLQASGLDPEHTGRWQGISAFVTPSVAWSLYAFLRTPDDYWSTVCTAIAVGGDTDTMAAMAGGIAGARVGTAGLPGGLVERLNDRGTWGAAELAALAGECAALFR